MSQVFDQNNSNLKNDIREKYNKFANAYASREPIQEVIMGVRKLRKNLLENATGKVLEIAVGTGVNLQYYSPGCEITAVDLSTAMLDIARHKSEKLGLNVEFQVADAEALGFPSRSFDTIVSSLTLCTFPDPIAALREMSRVCKPDGCILLLEHGRSDREWLGRWQDRGMEKHAERLSCYWNREPLELVKEAGLQIIYSHRYFLGMFHAIKAAP